MWAPIPPSPTSTGRGDPRGRPSPPSPKKSRRPPPSHCHLPIAQIPHPLLPSPHALANFIVIQKPFPIYMMILHTKQTPLLSARKEKNEKRVKISRIHAYRVPHFPILVLENESTPRLAPPKRVTRFPTRSQYHISIIPSPSHPPRQLPTTHLHPIPPIMSPISIHRRKICA